MVFSSRMRSSAAATSRSLPGLVDLVVVGVRRRILVDVAVRAHERDPAFLDVEFLLAHDPHAHVDGITRKAGALIGRNLDLDPLAEPASPDLHERLVASAEREA